MDSTRSVRTHGASGHRAGAAPLTVSLGILGVGFALANPPTTNALPQREVGAEMKIFRALFFLGGGAGPAPIGALLAARTAAGSEALNPLHTLHAASFSDAYPEIAVAVLTTLAASFGLRGGPEKGPKRGGAGRRDSG